MKIKVIAVLILIITLSSSSSINQNEDTSYNTETYEAEISEQNKDASETQIETDLINSMVDAEPTNISLIDEETAVELVRSRMKDLNEPRYYGDDTFVRVDHLDDNMNYVIQVYNSGVGMSNTINWYTVDRNSNQLTPMFDE